ncbi:copper chaperone PCu(A)C [Phenylobacterium sp.]|uniref:copper chaperone PCu(A)C n=1 Tax=Phenylobacterium sp. TaxID=1871053 RepID=UPI002E34BC48|nr:copper chaperone PCu(A)C [Phenylobacterium sp.]HEX4711376.1 copper chaperone PCu(A)C [Phenylobacterium sp.]
MKSFLIAAVVAALALPLTAYGSGKMEVLNPWSRPAVAGTNGVGYMVLANHGRTADALEKVESPLASRVEIHSMSMAGGVMSMAKVDAVPVPPGGEATFGPGAYHLMLIGLTKTLRAGDQAPATLTFASGAKLNVAFAVSAGMGPTAMAPMAPMRP